MEPQITVVKAWHDALNAGDADRPQHWCMTMSRSEGRAGSIMAPRSSVTGSFTLYGPAGYTSQSTVMNPFYDAHTGNYLAINVR
ncbi:MAG: hypothetical protein ACYDAR_07495 [Thermomicrobiales bacterium]